jgi:hypothetical protein
MKHLLELLELPGQVIGAISVLVGGLITGGVTLLAQIPSATAGVVAEAPTWFLAFGAMVVISLAWACLTLARYAAVTQSTSNAAVKESMEQQTRVLTNLAATIERQNKFWEHAGITAINRSMADPDMACDFQPDQALSSSRRNHSH